MFAFTRPKDLSTQAFARSLGAVWAGGSDKLPPEPLDAEIIFATVGDLVPLSLKSIRKGGRVVGAGIHMGASGVVLSLDVWCDDALAAITFRCDLLEQAAKRFNVEGIHISIPQTMVVLKDDRHFDRTPEKPSAGVNTP